MFLIEQIASVAEGSTRNDEMTVTGRSLEGIAMAERLVEPPAGESHDRQTAVAAETAIKHYLRAHAADLAAPCPPGARARRRRRRRAGPDRHRRTGATRACSTSCARSASSQGSAGRSPTTQGPATSCSTSWTASTGSASVFFDFAFETLERWEELDSVIDAKTVALVAGQGEGVARDLVTRWSGTEPAGFDRREAFLDARDVELGETTVLAQRGDAFLAATGAETSLEADVHQYGGFRYREHWDVGDVVTVRNAERGLSYPARDRRGREVLRAERRRADDHGRPSGAPFPTLASQATSGRAAATADGAVSAASGGVPVGSVVLWPAPAPPTDWLTCDGASLLRSAYPALFAVLGTTYGAADGTHFCLPDYRGRVPVGPERGRHRLRHPRRDDRREDRDAVGPRGHPAAAHTRHPAGAHANHAVTQAAGARGASPTARTPARTSRRTRVPRSRAHSSHNHELPFVIDDTHAISSINQTVFGTGAARTRRWSSSTSSASGSYAVAQSESVGLLGARGRRSRPTTPSRSRPRTATTRPRATPARPSTRTRRTPERPCRPIRAPRSATTRRCRSCSRSIVANYIIEAA